MGARRGIFISALLVGVLAVGAATARAGFGIFYPKGPDPAVREWPSWPAPVSCGGLSFDPVAAFGGPTEAEKGPGEPEAVLRSMLDEFASRAGVSRHYWRIMAATEDRVEFAEGRLSQGPLVIPLERTSAGWRPPSAPHYCAPRTVQEGSEGARWAIDGSQTLSPNTRLIKVDLSPTYEGCDGGRSLNEAARRPVFRQFGKRLVMTIWLEPIEPGIYTCQKLIEPPLVVRLPGRLGDRRLFDGLTYPPRPRT